VVIPLPIMVAPSGRRAALNHKKRNSILPARGPRNVARDDAKGASPASRPQAFRVSGPATADENVHHASSDHGRARVTIFFLRGRSGAAMGVSLAACFFWLASVGVCYGEPPVRAHNPRVAGPHPASAPRQETGDASPRDPFVLERRHDARA